MKGPKMAKKISVKKAKKLLDDFVHAADVRYAADAAGDKGRNSARSLSDFGLVESRAFVEELTLRTHRTLQQKAMGVFIQAMVAWAENYNKGSGWYDARNEATVKMSAKIVEMLEKENLIYRGQAVLPLI